MSNGINPISLSVSPTNTKKNSGDAGVNKLVSDVQGKISGVKADFVPPGDGFTLAKRPNGEVVRLDQYGEQL